MGEGTVRLFVSPHFDDAVLSCGGTIASWVARGDRCTILTVFGGGPAPNALLNPLAQLFHQRTGLGPRAVNEARQREDVAAAEVLGAQRTALEFPDACYRGQLYATREALRGPVKAADDPLRRAVAAQVEDIWRSSGATAIYLPLGVGGHVDHQICCSLGEALLVKGASVSYYEDYPYAAIDGAIEQRIVELGLRLTARDVDVSSQLGRRCEAISKYGSQLPLLFGSQEEPSSQIARFAARYAMRPGGFGERFWDASSLGRGT
jgi:LmbE family N-acetylglucosaminyl deacetylase